MKKLLLFIAFSILSSIGLYAQYDKYMEIGAVYTPQVTSILTPSHSHPIYQNRLTFAGAGGLTFSYNFNKNFGLQTGLLYSSHNQKFRSEIREGDGGTFESTGKKRLDYLNLPLLVKLNFPFAYKRRISTTVYFGPQIGYLLKGDGAVVVWRHFDNHDFYDLPESNSDYYNRFVLDGVAGFGFEYRVSRFITLHTSIRAEFSLTDIENKDMPYRENDLFYYFGDPDRGSTHNLAIGIQFGVAYRFNPECLTCPSLRW
ncbi:porin family protein [Cytophagaceae bacterium ABcell3]|nr:porin family protein [Cytophagaceae bacterium ABcell3]